MEKLSVLMKTKRKYKEAVRHAAVADDDDDDDDEEEEEEEGNGEADEDDDDRHGAWQQTEQFLIWRHLELARPWFAILFVFI